MLSSDHIQRRSFSTDYQIYFDQEQLGDLLHLLLIVAVYLRLGLVLWLAFRLL